MVSIFGLALGEIVLPIIIGHHAIGDVALQLEPAVEDGELPILGKCQANLGHGTGIDAQGLTTTGEGLVL